MYFIKYHPLKDRLRNRSVSDREALPYLIIFVILTFLPNALPAVDGFNYWDGILAFLSVIVAIGGVWYAYRENGGETGYDFVQKYVVLGWVVFVRYFVGFFPVLMLLLYVGILAGVNSSSSTGPYFIVVSILFQSIFYQRLGRHIKDTAKAS